MANITVGTTIQTTDDKEGVQKIPHNKTLIAIQLTDHLDAEPLLVSTIDSLSSLFSYYAPKKKIFLTTLTGSFQENTLSFKSLKDFEPKQLEILSTTQQVLSLQKEYYATAVRLIHTTDALQKSFLIPEERAYYLENLQQLKLLLDNNKETSIPLLSKTKNPLAFLVASVIDWMNDPRAVRQKAAARSVLVVHVEVWQDLYAQKANNIKLLIDYARSQSQKASTYFRKNMQLALQENKQLEQSYRTVGLFFANTEAIQLSNVHFIDASLTKLSDMEDTRIYDVIATALTDGFDRLDLIDNYGLLLIPGFLEQQHALEKFAKVAFQNKVFLCTDFRHLENPDDVVSLFEERTSTGIEPYKGNVLMACNWLVGRGLNRQYAEPEHLYIPPSAVLAGKIYKNEMSQASAGTTYGLLNAVRGTCFHLKKGEISYLEKIGLIPIVFHSGMVYAQSSKTLFTGANIGLQTYSVVRVFDYVTKALMDFLNRKTFESFNTRARKNLMEKIVHFMDDISGAGKLIENFKVTRFEQDIKERDRVHLQIHMTPYFPAKNFILSMDGQQGAQGKTWEAHYAQLN